MCSYEGRQYIVVHVSLLSHIACFQGLIKPYQPNRRHCNWIIRSSMLLNLIHIPMGSHPKRGSKVVEVLYLFFYPVDSNQNYLVV